MLTNILQNVRMIVKEIRTRQLFGFYSLYYSMQGEDLAFYGFGWSKSILVDFEVSTWSLILLRLILLEIFKTIELRLIPV